jgi:hypothetical protein
VAHPPLSPCAYAIFQVHRVSANDYVPCVPDTALEFRP